MSNSNGKILHRYCDDNMSVNSDNVHDSIKLLHVTIYRKRQK